MSYRKKSSKKHAPQNRSGTSVPSALPLGLLWGIAIIALAVFFAYLPSISGGFIMDDDKLLTNNRLIMDSNGLYRFWCTTDAPDYWPISNSTLWMEWRMWKMNPTGYRVTNLILHVVEALMVWLILRKLSIPGAFLAAMLFAVHPVNVESVAWISQRKDMLAVLFFLFSILFYLKSEIPCPPSPVPRPLFYWLSLLAFLLAMLSKGSVVILPVLLLGIVCRRRGTVPIFVSTKMGLSPSVPNLDSTKMGLSISRGDLLRIAPFFVVAAVLTLVNLWFRTHGTVAEIRSDTFPQRLLGAGGVVWFYLYKALLPLNLVFIYPQWRIEAGNLLWWLPLLAALAVTAALWPYRKSWSRPLLFAWGFFCVALVPVMGFMDVGFMQYSLVADHYQHIAIIAVIVLAAAFWSLWRHRVALAPRQCWAATVVAILAVGTLTFLTWRQNGLYRDPMTLYQATLKNNPECWLIQNNLGNMLSEMGRQQEAIEHLEQALRLNPDFYEAHINLGATLAQGGRPQEAIEHYIQAMRLKPKYPEAYNNLGRIFLDSGRFQEGIKYCEQALRLKPDYPDAHYNLGNALVQSGRPKEAIEHYEKVLRLDPDFTDAHNNLGAALVLADRPEEAIEHYQQALRLKPDFPEAHNNLGKTLFDMGRPEEAIEHCKQALRLKPDYPDAHFNWGNALSKLGRQQEAIAHFQKALQLNPDYAEAYNNIGAALLKIDRPGEAIAYFLQAVGLRPDYIEAYFNLTSTYAQTNRSEEAVAAAQKALELARSQGQTALAKQIEDWLISYRAGLSNLPNTAPAAESAPPPP